MTIGVKLDIGFENIESCRRLFGTRNVLARIFRVSEFAPWKRRSTSRPISPLSPGTSVCARRRVSACPSIRTPEGTLCNPAHFSKRRSVLPAVSYEGVHGGRGRSRPPGPPGGREHPWSGGGQRRRTAALSSIESIRFFTWSREWCAENAPHVTVVAELQFRPHAGETIQRIGDRLRRAHRHHRSALESMPVWISVTRT